MPTTAEGKTKKDPTLKDAIVAASTLLRKAARETESYDEGLSRELRQGATDLSAALSSAIAKKDDPSAKSQAELDAEEERRQEEELDRSLPPPLD